MFKDSISKTLFYQLNIKLKTFLSSLEISNQYVPSASKIDENALKKLTDMGFPTNRARKALFLNK